MEKISILDFGGQYTHLIANRIRRLGVYSEILPNTVAASDLKGYAGIILSGSPHSVLEQGHPTIDPAIFSLGIPVLGLCYGLQLMSKLLGGQISHSFSREYGIAEMHIEVQDPLFKELDPIQSIWMSHGDSVAVLSRGFQRIGSTDSCANAAACDPIRKLYGLQFHPEVTHTPHGMKILRNFCDLCGCSNKWQPSTFASQLKDEIRARCSGKKVFLLVSGGVDSTVAFFLLNEALGPDRVMGLHIDNGLMRHGESADILVYMKKHGFNNLIIENAAEEFVSRLSGVINPEEKRKIIGDTFIAIQQQAQRRLDLNANEWLLGQGTIYPDTIESAGTKHADRIKTHHNRVDIILELIEKGLVIEPLSQLYKDEVRALGEALNLPRELVWRHPFPGPGLGVRTLCSDGVAEPLPDDLEARIVEHIRDWGYFAQVLPIRSVGVQGDSRTYAHPVLLNGDCDWEVLERVSTQITNLVPEINRVIYNLSGNSKPYSLIRADVCKPRLDILRKIDRVVTAALFANNDYDEVWQMPVVLLPLVNSAGRQCVVLRPIQSQEAMTARFQPLKPETIAEIIAGVKKIGGAGDLFFDVTNKPPATIEWE